MLLDPSDQLTRFGKVTQNLRHLPQSELWECEDQCQILCCLIMYSRAYILLQRDFQELKRNNYKGINAFPISEDLLEWEVDIKGLQNTIWQGSFFQLTISFTSEYNFVPPVVRFRTIPFHPNVDPYTGRPCIDFLDNPRKWNRNYTLSSILLTLQVMLSNPVLENPVNLEAAQILMKDETLYRLIILRLSRQALKLNNDSSESHKEPDKLIRSIKSVSFNDYFKTWSEIATSKATECYRTPLLDDPDFIGEYYKWKKNEIRHPKEWHLNSN
ncbi:ubiquitin-conjugating enzyme E2 U isoform X6 [Sus scrofa]|uniref:ubiquitin-conjugating enzyme E2 U isoform X6 n=1 Tax=Sus scrofa TaxID=9823 RepID=UPI000A2B0183|nr:ubiquitin-conjugating enzyme E2 U isoform X6 [Sus scrofa]